MRIIIAILLALIASSVTAAELTSHPTQTEPIHVALHPEALYEAQRDMLEWLDKHTSYRTDLGKPRYVFTSSANINALYYGATDNLGNVAAVYTAGTVYLPHSFQLPQDAPTLLHELVHFLQHANAAPFACVAQLERQAYLLAHSYARERGLPLPSLPLSVFAAVCE